MTYLALGGLTLLLTLAATRLLLQPGSLFYILDHPGKRSLHARPTPRTGGMAMLAALSVAWGVGLLAAVPLLANPFALGGFVLISAVSLLDDVQGLHQLTRMVVHLAAAALLLLGGFTVFELELPSAAVLPLGPLGPPLTMLAVVWLCNLYNFMDGMDGLAGGMGLIGFAALAWLGWRVGHEAFAMTALLLASANLGFLAFNFPPARIFMGDAGAVPMGFAAATLALWGARDGLFAWWMPLLIFSPFVVDATVTLCRRALRHERVWQAHRSHFYQRVVLLGWSHRRTVLVEYVLMLGTGGTAIVLSSEPSGAAGVAALAVWALIYLVLALFVAWAERRRNPGT